MTITTYVISRSPKVHRGLYVVRAWYTHPGRVNPVASINYHVCDSLADARAVVPEGLRRLPPVGGDDPTIEETWL